MHTPRVFVSYRRADEPFAAGLLSSLLSEGVGQHEVFLDTRYLRQRGNFGPQLLDAVRNSLMVLAVVGPAWDSEVNLGRLRRPEDWVRQELLTAKEHRIPIVPVLVDRALPPAVFAELGLEPETGLRLDPDRYWAFQPELLSWLSRRPEAPPLRFAGVGNIPGRPNGSAVVVLTRRDFRVLQLDETFAAKPVASEPLGTLVDVERHDRRQAFLRVSDLRFRFRNGPIEIRRMFADEADDLLDLLPPAA